MTIDDMVKPIEDEAVAGFGQLAAEIDHLRKGRGDASSIVDRIRDLADLLRDYRNIAGEDIAGARLTKMLGQQ